MIDNRRSRRWIDMSRIKGVNKRMGEIPSSMLYEDRVV